MSLQKTLLIAAVIIFSSFLRVVAFDSNYATIAANFSPIGAIALFAGVHFRAHKGFAFLIPLIAMVSSDLLIGYHSTLISVYLSFALITWIGFKIGQSPSFVKVLGGSIAGSVLFYLITNGAHWALTDQYAKDLGGLFLCYVKAIPFADKTFLGDLAYNGLLFGVCALVSQIKGLRTQTAQVTASIKI